MGMVQSGDLFGLGLTADGTLVGADTGLTLGGLSGHGTLVPLVAQSGHFVSLIAVAAGAGIGGVALLGAGGSGHNLVVAVGMGGFDGNAAGSHRGVQRFRGCIGQSAHIDGDRGYAVRSIRRHSKDSAHQHAVTRNISSRSKAYDALFVVHCTASQQTGSDSL